MKHSYFALPQGFMPHRIIYFITFLIINILHKDFDIKNNIIIVLKLIQ